MEDEITTVQVSKATREKLRAIAKDDLRSMASEFEWLIEMEYARRYSRPNQAISVAEAEQAQASQE